MRARHRHFNAGDAGAAICLDARFISGLADAAAVSTWSDRTSNAANATQSGANRPIYKVNIQGGQPVVRFDGTDDYYPMETPLATVFRNKSYGIVIATVQDRTPTGGRGSHYLFYSSINTNTTRSRMTTRLSSTGNFATGARRLNADSVTTTTVTPNDSNWNILAAEHDWANNINRLRINFTSRATSEFSSGAGSTSDDNAVNSEIGSAIRTPTSWAAPIDLGQLVILNTTTTEALVKRLHHSAAYSFKIACN